jgi:hypothetical protein
VLPLTIAQAAEPVVAELSQMSYFPVTLWALVTGLSLVIVIVVLCTYLFYHKFLNAIGDDASSLADLAAQKRHLEAEIAQCQKWLQENREELLRKDAERQEQEFLRQELARLQMDAAQTQQTRDALIQQAGDLQNVVSTLVQDRDRLLGEKVALDREKGEAETAKRAAEEERQRADTEAQQAEQGLRVLEARYKEEKERVDQLVQDIADKEVRQQLLMREVTALTDAHTARQEELLKLETERREQEDLRNKLDDLRRDIVQQEHEMHSLRKEASELQSSVSTLTQERDRLATEKATLDRERTAAEATAKDAEEARQRAVEAARQTEEALQNLIERYKEEQRHRNEILQDLSDKEIKMQSLMQGMTALDQERIAAAAATKDAEATRQRAVEVARQAEEALKSLTEHRQEEQQRRDEILRDISDKEIKMQSLVHEIAALTERLADLHTKDGDSTDDPYIDLFTPPLCLGEDIFPGGAIGQRDEEEALTELQQRLKAQGLLFPDRTLKAFHTSLKVGKINPLTVLAGVSGTGKSRLPIEYAKTMGMYTLIVSVQPRWDSPQDLFGFYNYLEHKYKATDVARTLVRMDKYNFNPGDFPSLEGTKRADRMLLILLDEMNLARIEYYFSEFLSKLEVRQSVSNPDDLAQRSPAEIELEIGPRTDESASFRLWVGENVLFVGTMNEDESTQTLSDKVLDRANVLRFGRPPDRSHDVRSISGGGVASQKGKFLTLSQWQKWLRDPSATALNPWDNDVSKWIVVVNEALDRIGRPFGYRVQQGIRAYVLNYPGVDGGLYKTAFADQVEQKVLPKLRGIDVRESAEALNEIEGVLEDLGDRDLQGAFQRSKDDPSGMFVWRGVTRPI